VAAIGHKLPANGKLLVGHPVACLEQESAAQSEPDVMLNAAERWTIGVCLALSNCALSSLGFTLQRKSHLLNQKDDENRKSTSDGNEATPAARSCHLMWAIGVMLYISASVPDVVSYAMVPQVVCSTMSCFRLVLVTVLAHFFLNEQVQRREVLGMTLCVAGTFLCLVYGPKPSEDDGLAEAGDLYHPEVYSYLLVGLASLLCLLLLEHSESFGLPQLPNTIHYLILPVTTGLAYSIEKVFNTEIGFLHLPEDLPMGFLRQPQWAAMAAAIGALGLTDFYLNVRGAQRMPVQIFIPSAFAFATALQFLQAVFVFGELKDMTSKDAGISMFGACASLAGAIVIQPPQSQPSCSCQHTLVPSDDGPSVLDMVPPRTHQLVSMDETA